MKIVSVVCLSAAALVSLETSAYAYLDPGTGSIILQAIVASVASSLFVIKMYWYKIKSLVGLGRTANRDDSADSAQ